MPYRRVFLGVLHESCTEGRAGQHDRHPTRGGREVRRLLRVPPFAFVAVRRGGAVQSAADHPVLAVVDECGGTHRGDVAGADGPWGRDANGRGIDGESHVRRTASTILLQ